MSPNTADTPDRTSKVPYYTFTEENAEAQWAELAENPLLQRMNACRESLASDRYRPTYHYVNPEHHLNDPNGLCYWQGKWHLFYQAYPPEDPRQHWGHAVSDDLVRWTDLPYAIYPNPEECCFSGSCYVEDDRVIAMYHGTKLGAMVATASDPLLLNWTKVKDGPVIPLVETDEKGFPYAVFDNCIWKEGEYYYALSGHVADGRHGEKTGRAVEHIFRSRDLINWIHLGEFVEGNIFGLPGDDGACPYFWPIGDKHILLTFSHTRSAQYILGEYDTKRQKLVFEEFGCLNDGGVGGGSIHAPSAYPDGNGGLEVIYNVNSGKPYKGWGQIMSLPRKYTLNERGELVMRPTDAVDTLRGEPVTISDLELEANTETVLPGIEGDAMELEIVLDMQETEAVSVDVLRSPEKQEFTRVTVYRNGGLPLAQSVAKQVRSKPGWVRGSCVTLDSTESSLAVDVNRRKPQSAEFILAEDNVMTLRLFVDRSIVEVFADNQTAVLTRVYPEREDSLGVSVISHGRPAKIVSLNAYPMENIWA